MFTFLYNWLIHIDERYFLFLPIFLVILSEFRLDKFKYAFYTFIILILMMSPWTYRNYVVYERPLILTERSSRVIDPLLNFKSPVNKFRNYKKNYYKTSDILFYEYFHGNNSRGVGASHQTGWTGIVAKLINKYKE